jgi:hypothetical protein
MQAESVSNEQLLEDVKNTELELSAYIKMYQGCDILSKLPENIGNSTGTKYLYEHQKYLNLANECNDFLVKLKRIKLERSLP